jgi:hypothetical protein
MKRIILAPFFSACLLTACSSEQSRPAITSNEAEAGVKLPSSGGSATPDAAADSGGDARADSGAACNTLVNTTIAVERIAVPNQLPVALGGALQDGTYRITDFAVYTGAGGSSGPTGATVAAVISLDNGRIEQVTKLNGNAEERSSGAFTVNGNSLVVTLSCPTAATPTTVGYTATASQLSLIFSSSNEVATYTKM